MGVIADKFIELKPKLKHILEISERIFTSRLQDKMLFYVMDSFKALRPLSHEFKRVKILNDGDELWVGEWLRYKHRSYYSNYVQPRGHSIDTKRYFFEIIREHGYDIASFVRRPIRDTFTKLVDLTMMLKPYENVQIDIEIEPKNLKSFTCSWYDEEKISDSTLIVRGLTLNPSAPQTIHFDNGSVLVIDDWRCMTMIEDLINDLVKLYEKADKIIGETREYNEAIQNKMKEIATPFLVANALK